MWSHSVTQVARCKWLLDLFHGCFAQYTPRLFIYCLHEIRILALLHHYTGNVYVWSVFKSLMSEKEASSFRDFKTERPLQCTSLHQLTMCMQTEIRRGRTGRSNLHKHIVVHVNCQEKEQNASELNTLCRTDRRHYSGKVKFCFSTDSRVIKLRSTLFFQ